MKSLHTAVTALGAFFLSLSAAQEAQAQFRATPPVVDGTASVAEYGSQYRSLTPSNQSLNWYMSWDDTNLYVAITDADVSQGNVIYLDTNPLQPTVNGGDDNNGSIDGFNQLNGYDNTSGRLPFRADAVIYIRPAETNDRPTYRETRKWDPEARQWSAPAENIGTSAFGAGSTREFSIPWSAISTTGTRPANFNWMGYITSPSGFVYGQVPRDLIRGAGETSPPGVIGRSANFLRYFTVLNTPATAATAFGPNGVDSYSHSGPDEDTFSAITVYDFTLNTSNGVIRRVGDASVWDIQGSLRVENGTLNLGGSPASVRVAGDLTFTDPATFTTGTAPFILTGTGPQTITGDDYQSLTVQGGGVKTLNSNLRIAQSLVLNNGTLVTGRNNVVLGAGARLTETQNGYLLGQVTAVSAPLTVPNLSSDFGGIGLTIAPRGDFPGTVSVLRITGGRGLLQGGPANNPNQTIARRFFITASNSGPGNSGTNVTLTFNYRDNNPNELNRNSETLLDLYESSNTLDPTVGPYQRVNTNGQSTSVARNAETNTFTFQGSLNLNGRYFSLADGTTPLPVELVSFTGKAENNAVRLNWATASELNNKGFEVEHSIDAASWRTLGFVAGNGTTSQRNNYTYVDRTAAAGTNYYRLRQIDLDGKSVYSQPVTVAGGAGEFTLSPVPATDVLTFNGLGAGQHTAEIYNSRGQRVLSQEFKADAATTVAVNSLPAGVYMVRVVGADRSTRNARFIKE